MKILALVIPLATLVLARAEAAEINVAHLDQQLGLGYGFNPVIGNFHPPCIKVVANQADKTIVSDPKAVVDIKKISSTTEFKKALNVHVYASVFGAAGQASAELSNIVAHGVSSNDSYFSIQVRVEGTREVLSGDIELTDSAIKALKISQAFFKSACGDSYVASLVSGGEFLAIVQLHNASEEESNKFLGQLKASYGTAKIDAGTESDFQTLSKTNRVDIHIAQTGHTTDHPSSLTDPEALLRYAAEFAGKLVGEKDSIPSVSSAIYANYSDSLNFKLALHEANISKLSSQSNSADIMEDLMQLYDASTDRIAIVENALNFNESYFDFDHDKASEYLSKMKKVRSDVEKAAKSCATAAADGGDCAEQDTVAIAEVPADIKRVPDCNVSAFASMHAAGSDSACTQVQRVDKNCYCTQCEAFLKSSYKRASSQHLQSECIGFAANTLVTARVHSKLSIAGTGIWPEVFFNGGKEATIMNQHFSGSSDVDLDTGIDRALKTTSKGSFPIDVTVNACMQDGSPQQTTCKFENIDPSEKSLVTVQSQN
ncbi:hypothetical protein C7I87_28315 [Mesorhizobium sp. SARCC-RB16n]|uniref:hypothetical protein n=1 Tax=Mesorhizobium sp. SARCC-RB16n TaxID=2116687 RepID=UPI00122EA865|nr:hypothetical protein [Mesorhizobium sp. SARCC-RB16n]KAA3447157.1 hypothetical protein C7I87_28315 [Mesorhizobium sp. SARCC-RB16n]